jgi:hypothetical protein
MRVESCVADVELDVRRRERHATQNVGTEQADAVLHEPRPVLDRQPLDLVLDCELAVGYGTGDSVLMQAP